MGKHDRKKRLAGPWRNLHTAVWLVGIAILAWKNWWWPGILVLVAISMILEEVLPAIVPQAYEYNQPQEAPLPAIPPVPPLTEQLRPSPAPQHRLDLLPTACPNCSGPIRGHEVKWTGEQSADCPYCGTNLPMAKIQG